MISEKSASVMARIGEQQAALVLAEETLRQRRLALDDLIGDLQKAGPIVVDEGREGELQKLRADNEELRRMLAAAQKGKPVQRDMDSLETELTEFGRQMEADRQKLDAE